MNRGAVSPNFPPYFGSYPVKTGLLHEIQDELDVGGYRRCYCIMSRHAFTQFFLPQKIAITTPIFNLVSPGFGLGCSPHLCFSKPPSNDSTKSTNRATYSLESLSSSSCRTWSSYQASLLPAALEFSAGIRYSRHLLKTTLRWINNKHQLGTPRTHTEKDLWTSQIYMRDKLGVSSTSQRICDELKPRGYIPTNYQGAPQKNFTGEP